MMNRTAFQELARLRLQEGRALLDKNKPNGAYYLFGYSVECALKACIAKKTKRHEFPDKKRVVDSYCHDLSKLLKLAGLEQELEKADRALQLNWTFVKDWKETSRYDNNISVDRAKELGSAINSRKHGVLRWIRQHW